MPMKELIPFWKKEKRFGRIVKSTIMKNIKTIGVIGAGKMGSALAQKFAQENFNVILCDQTNVLVETGLGSITTSFNEGVEKQVFSKEQITGYLSKLHGTIDLKELHVCDLIIEAIYEDFKAKSELFKRLEKIITKETILATNTSSFSVTELSGELNHPERFIGLHYFYHAAKNRLVEIIPGKLTNQETYESAKAFSVLSGKDAIISKDSYGFIVNRYFVPWLNEATRMLEENLTNIPTIEDVCIKVFGIGMGPFALMNATGIPVAYHSQKTLESLGSFYTVSKKLKSQSDSKQEWNLEGKISEEVSIRNTVKERMLGVIFLICSQLLDEKVCSATDINRGSRIGLKWKKGPVELMSQTGEEEVKQLIGQIVKKYKMELPKSIGEKFWHMESVTLEKNKNIAVITMNQPENLNALCEKSMQQLHENFSLADNDDTIDTIFITGSGKTFVAGADIKFFINKIKSNQIQDIIAFTHYGQKIFDAIDKSRKNVVAVLNGPTLGGGLELALCADMIIATPKATLAFPETGIGIFPGLCGTYRAQKKIGKGLAKYLVMTGKMLNASDAQTIGLVDAIVDPAEAMLFMNGSQKLPRKESKKLTAQWDTIRTIFENQTINELIDAADLSKNSEVITNIAHILKQKAPLALKITEQLMEESKRPCSDLENIRMIFSTEDALLGLSNIGKQVHFSSK